MKILRSIVVLAALAATAGARASDIYVIDTGRSRIAFGVHQFLGLTEGKFNQFGGTIHIDRERPEHSSVEAQIEVKSIDTGIRKRDEHLLGSDFFDAEKFAQITFRSGIARQTSKQAGDIVGELTMHGVTKPITLHVKLNTPMAGVGTSQRLRWTVVCEPIRRRDFNLMFSRAAEAISGISQEVTVEIEIEANKAP